MGPIKTGDTQADVRAFYGTNLETVMVVSKAEQTPIFDSSPRQSFAKEKTGE
jgi:hypothetical protein